MEKANDYLRIEKAIHYLRENMHHQPSLEEVAEHVHLSEFHFQRLFTQWAGISPKKFLQFITLDALKQELAHAPSIQAAAENVGLSAQSRVYDLFVNLESVTPQEFKTQGKGIHITYGVCETPFGDCFIAQTDRGICSMSFADGNTADLVNALQQQWQQAELHENQKAVAENALRVFSPGPNASPLRLFVKGTPFQVKVWEALLKIPFGSVSTYQRIAAAIGKPDAMRAVGTAVGSNPVAYIIPCHRVIRSEGIIGQYHWGADRKTALIGWEKSQRLIHS